MIKRLMLGLMLAAGLLLLAPAPQAEASSWGWHSGSSQPAKAWRWRSHRRWRTHWWRYWREKDNRVPELDAGAAGSAMVLLLGGVAYIASRRRDDQDV